MKKSKKRKKVINRNRTKSAMFVKKKWTKRDIPLQKDGYWLGPHNRFFLSKSALNHILVGDFSERLVENNGHRTGDKVLVLKGGLHTYSAWINFKKNYKSIKNLRFYNSRTDDDWYFARTLKNGVITLKIPRIMFQTKAANLTRYPDLYYKSGYLWKTLFPLKMDANDILSIIDEALHYKNIKESSDKIIYGYALRYDPHTLLKVRIQCRNNMILSAFPTWEQPVIGNNGKAYSHSDTIGFTFAASTEYFGDNAPSAFSYSCIKRLKDFTPWIILNRTDFRYANDIIEWKHNRESELSDYALSMSEENIEELLDYISKNYVIKEGYNIQLDAYNCIHDLISKDLQTFNAIFINLNIIEILKVVFLYDNQHSSYFLQQLLDFILLNKIVFTGALDSFNNKILHNEILKLILGYHNEEILKQYVVTINKSPIRNTLYTEFDIFNICLKPELNHLEEDNWGIFSCVSKPFDFNDNDFPFKKKYFIEYMKLHLSENYFINFDEKMRDRLIEENLSYQGCNFELLLSDCMKSASVNDFYFFSIPFKKIITRLISNKIKLPIEILKQLLTDYFRIQTAQRFKIYLKHPYLKLHPINHFEVETTEYKTHTIINHERRMTVMNLEYFIDVIIEMANYLNDSKLKSIAEDYKTRVWTERPPMLHFVPSYIEHWANSANKYLKACKFGS